MPRSANRHELTDEQWAHIAPIFPLRRDGPGRPRRDPREMLDAMLWWLRTGAPWRDLPDFYGPWETVYSRFRIWRQEGLLDRIVERLQVELDDAGDIDWDLWCIDGTNVRAARCAAGGGKGGARKSPRITR
jgi:transposase